MKNNKKINYSGQKKKWFLFGLPFVVIFISTFLIFEFKADVKVQGESESTPVAVIQSAKDASETQKVIRPILSDWDGVYVLSKKAAPCKNYDNTTIANRFSFRCRETRAIYRGIWTKTIEVKDYNKLQLSAYLGVKNHTDNYFAECGNGGVNSNNSVDLMVLSHDPDKELSAECNHEVGEEKWHHCLIENNDKHVITHCGISKCASSRGCNMEIDVSGKNEIYLLFRVDDNWFADVEGILSDVKITLTK